LHHKRRKSTTGAQGGSSLELCVAGALLPNAVLVAFIGGITVQDCGDGVVDVGIEAAEVACAMCGLLPGFRQELVTSEVRGIRYVVFVASGGIACTSRRGKQDIRIDGRQVLAVPDRPVLR
jgi:hypothetical protein